MRRKLEALFSSMIPDATTSAAISADEKRQGDRFRFAGSSQATAVTSALKVFGRPNRSRSERPSSPPMTKRFRHSNVEFTTTLRRRPISTLVAPPSASSTISARRTRRTTRCSRRPHRTRCSSSWRSKSLSGTVTGSVFTSETRPDSLEGSLLKSERLAQTYISKPYTSIRTFVSPSYRNIPWISATMTWKARDTTSARSEGRIRRTYHWALPRSSISRERP